MTATCAHCEDLQTEVDYLRSELGLSLDAAMVTAWRSLGLTINEASVVQALRQAYPRPLTPGQVLDATAPRDVAHGEDRSLELPRVLVCKIRKKLGADAILSGTREGYRLSERAAQLVDFSLMAEGAEKAQRLKAARAG